MTNSQEIYNFNFNTIEGKQTSLEEFKDNTILIVNTASECGLTPQYEDLEEVYNKCKDRGFVVIGFPCNDFGGQEPGSEEEIQSFCQKNYGVTFPMMSKIHVKGEDTHPLYSYLKEETGTEIAWNFQKYLIDKEGNIVSMIEPQSKITEDENLKLIEEKL